MKLLYVVTTALLLGNGAAMLLVPDVWFDLTPGVRDTGAMNIHFVRDVGVGYCIAGIGLLWRAVDNVRGWPAAMIGAGFILGHAIVHLVESLFGHSHGGIVEWLLVYPVAVWVGWLAMPGKTVLSHWIKPLLRRQVSQFETQFGYDARYMHEMLNHAPDAFLQFSQLVDLAKYRVAVPLEVWYATKITAAISEDCGPCTQLAVTMALGDGVPNSQLNALIEADTDAMDEEIRLGFAYAVSVINHAPDAIQHVAAIEARWGKEALVSLALAMAVARVFPMVKYGMGHGQTCAKVNVGKTERPVERSWLSAEV